MSLILSLFLSYSLTSSPQLVHWSRLFLLLSMIPLFLILTNLVAEWLLVAFPYLTMRSSIKVCGCIILVFYTKADTDWSAVLFYDLVVFLFVLAYPALRCFFLVNSGITSIWVESPPYWLVWYRWEKSLLTKRWFLVFCKLLLLCMRSYASFWSNDGSISSIVLF